jgi:hypothetical protein
MGSSYIRQSFGEYLAFTVRIPTTEAADLEADPHRESLPRKVLQMPNILAMEGMRDLAAGRALGFLARTDLKRESTFIALDAFED